MQTLNDYISVQPIEFDSKTITGTITSDKTQVHKILHAEDEKLEGKIALCNKFASIEVSVGTTELFFIKKSDIIALFTDEEFEDFINPNKEI